MSYNNSNTFRLSNEQLLLVNILNTMYNDNLRHINSITETLNSLVDSNNQIRNSLSQLLNLNQNTYNNTRQNNRNRRWENTASTFGRIMINNRPYVVDSINEYTIPRNRRNNNSEEMFTQLLNNFMQPVEIYPTQSQIETATRRVRYCDISRPINTSCPISMEDFEDNNMVTVIRHCGHIFHTDYLLNWFRTNCRCPVCRYDIRDYNFNVSNQFFNTSQDSSNNNLERNNTETILLNHTFGPGIGNGISADSLENLFNITRLMERLSGIAEQNRGDQGNYNTRNNDSENNNRNRL